MKIRIRPHNPGVFDEADWLQMDGWLAKLRDDGNAGQPTMTTSSPRTASDVRLEALAQPARAEAPACAESAGSALRAVIGDQLRMPVMWCEMGSCISWRTDPAALGEADARARAISVGWRIDALGGLACPQCQQTDPRFWATSPVVRWDRYTAVARAATACGESTVSQPAPPYPRRWS